MSGATSLPVSGSAQADEGIRHRVPPGSIAANGIPMGAPDSPTKRQQQQQEDAVKWTYLNQTISGPLSSQLAYTAIGVILDIATLVLLYHTVLTTFALIEQFKETATFPLRTWRIFTAVHLALVGALFIIAIVINLLSRSTSAHRAVALTLLGFLTWQVIWSTLFFTRTQQIITDFDIAGSGNSTAQLATSDRFSDLGQPPVPMSVVLHIQWHDFLSDFVLVYMFTVFIFTVRLLSSVAVTWSERKLWRQQQQQQQHQQIQQQQSKPPAAAPSPIVELQQPVRARPLYSESRL